MMTSRSPRPRAVRHAAGPVPGGVPFILLEHNRRAQATGPVRDPGQPGDELRGLQAQPHLVAVVLPADRGAMHPEPTWTRKIMPSSAILRASSEACGCAKPAGSAVEPATGRHERDSTVQF